MNQENYICVNEQENNLREVILAREARRNALSFELITQLTQVLKKAATDQVRGVLLSSRGDVFSAGHDFGDMLERDLPKMQELMRYCSDLMLTIQKLPCPVVAKVQGAAIGAGCQLALSCDLIVASENAFFITPGGKGGWFCTTPMVALTRALPPKRALEMLFTGESVSATQAENWGMINRVCAPNKLDEVSLELLILASRGSLKSKAIGKKAFYDQLHMQTTEAYEHASDIMARSGVSAEGRETMRAFIEKRSPKF